MISRFQTRMAQFLALCGSGAFVCTLEADQRLAETEARTAASAAIKQNLELEAQLAAEKESNQLLAAKVGILTAEAASLRAELNQAKLLNEALGAGATSERGLEKRVLDAINDLRLVKEQKDELEAKLQKLSETVSVYLAATDEQRATLREKLTRELAAASAAADTDTATPNSAARIESSRVVSVKPEQKLVVFNAGLEAGMKVGTPLRIYRNDRPTASAVVIEVRPHVSGGLITQTETDAFPKVGDSLRIDTRTAQ